MHTRKHGLIRVAGVLSFGILITLSYLFVNPTTINSGLTTLVYAEGNDTPATSGTPFPSLVTLNIDLTHPNASVELTPHDNTGTFSSSSEDNSVAFNVSTNNYSGYTLYISSSSNDGYLSPASITTPTTENSLSSIDEIITESDFSNPSSTTLNNKWGYKPSKYNSETNTSFIPSPSIINPATHSDILDTTTTYNTTTAGDPITTETNTEDIDANTYTIGLGARVDSTILTGSYEGTFVLQVVGNPVPVTINYTDTSGDSTVTSTLPSTYIGEVSETRAPISTAIPTRTGYTFKSWCLGTVTAGTSENSYVDTCTGTTYNASNSTDGTQYISVDLTHSNTVTLVAMWEVVSCDNTKLCVQYNGNGLNFDGRQFNRVNYSGTYTSTTKYSHTPNLTDTGERDTSYNGGNGIGNYANRYTMNQVVTIDGASTLHIRLTYGGESASYDWVSFWAGNFPNYTGDDYKTGIQNCGGGTVTNGKYGGTNGTTVECDIPGDTVTFAFKSDSSSYGNGYGYYAIIDGISSERAVASGKYTTPTGANAIFYGWSSAAVTPGVGFPSQVEYASESEVMARMPGNEGETRALYAVWQRPYPITFTKDSNVSSIAVLDASGNTVGTISSSGGSINLLGGSTYTVKPTYASGYTMNSASKTTGEGTLTQEWPYANFVVGVGSATINISSRARINLDKAFANAGKTKYNGYYKMQDMNSTICSNVDIMPDDLSIITSVIDVRDNQVYTIGKLKDGKCWLLENLRLGAATFRQSLSTSNTNMSPSVSFSMSNSSSSEIRSYTVPQWIKDYANNAVPLAVGLSGTGKQGVYYNYCAATAGTYCYDKDTVSSDPSYDICPSGWRLPTGNFGEYHQLYGKYSSASDFAASLKLPLSATYYGDAGYPKTSFTEGCFFSSTIDSKYAAYYLRATETGVGTRSSTYDRVNGMSVRCVAK